MLTLVNFGSNELAGMVILIAVLWLALILIALYHITRNNQVSFVVKVLWFIIIISAPFIGSIIYLIWGKNKEF
ncbi:PLDc N-terminal domain-containing protein [Pedobacter mucosus]|uniref:PLDc N-terminal domain-containing protein n=1 Tax=Pedobacter mucosus TaxID=2895286 RepID=UPI001EE43CD9|nr:PLDc N-terminal domain-containing protein [Pedobacter mucosus]UKT63828.1 PLDc N-terminal domain-containing protein [Pedobacter mucosus]